MKPRSHIPSIFALLFCVALPAWGQQYMYVPQQAAEGRNVSSPDGILVQEIEIKKGDTLFGLSRKFNGRGMYYPQILLFNEIKNPDLIYAGKILKIPVSKQSEGSANQSGVSLSDNSHSSPATKESKAVTAPVTSPSTDSSAVSSGSELSLSDLKSVGTDKKRAGKATVLSKNTKTHLSPSKTPLSTRLPVTTPQAAESSSTVAATSGQKLFEAAVKAYRQNDCRTALDLLDRYLVNNSHTALAADANLYKADCYLKLSAQ